MNIDNGKEDQDFSLVKHGASEVVSVKIVALSLVKVML